MHDDSDIRHATVRVPPRHAGIARPGRRSFAGTPSLEPGPDGAPSTTACAAADQLVQAIERLRNCIESLSSPVSNAANGDHRERLTAVDDAAAETQRCAERWLDLALAAGAALDDDGVDGGPTPTTAWMRPVDIGAVIDRAGRAFSLEWRPGALQIVLDIDEEPPLVAGDPDQLHEAIMLLFEECSALGARHATTRIEESAASVTVVVQADCEPADAGGASTHADARSDRRDGIRRIVEAHGGDLREAKAERDRSFYITLPRSEAN